MEKKMMTLNELLERYREEPPPPLYISNGNPKEIYYSYWGRADRETICHVLHEEEALLFALYPCEARYKPTVYLKEKYANAVIKGIIRFPDGWIVFVNVD